MPETGSTLLPYPPLLVGAELHVCLTCGAVVPDKGIDIHETWHQAISYSAIEAHRRLDLIKEVA
jgi:hypothetical protein